MKNKSFDCVEMKREIQEKLWVEAGETIEGLIKLLQEKSQQNPLIKEFNERKEKEKEKQLKSA